jgi:hypothetical protein
MVDKDLPNEGADAQDPDHLHAPLVQVIAAVAPADEITKARHLRVALAAFEDLSSTTPITAQREDRSRVNSPRRLRLHRSLGAVAAAALLIVGFGVVLPLLSSNGGQDSDLRASDRSAEPAAAMLIAEDEAEDQISEMMVDSPMVQRLFNLSGRCDAEIETYTFDEVVEPNEIVEGEIPWSWVGFEASDAGQSILVVASLPGISTLAEAEEAAQFARAATEPAAVTLVLDPTSCALLRTERAGPEQNR